MCRRGDKKATRRERGVKMVGQGARKVNRTGGARFGKIVEYGRDNEGEVM